MLVGSVGIPSLSYSSAWDFQEDYDAARPGCAVLDARLPGRSGVDLLSWMATQDVCSPVIIVTAHADVPLAVQAMKAGAFDFIEKPVRPQHLLDRIQKALERDRRIRIDHARRAIVRARASSLTPRERQVMYRVVAGQLNREIAAQLGVTPKAVEAFRSRAMRKMHAANLAELVCANAVLAGTVDALAPENLEERLRMTEIEPDGDVPISRSSQDQRLAGHLVRHGQPHHL